MLKTGTFKKCLYIFIYLYIIKWYLEGLEKCQENGLKVYNCATAFALILSVLYLFFDINILDIHSSRQMTSFIYITNRNIVHNNHNCTSPNHAALLGKHGEVFDWVTNRRPNDTFLPHLWSCVMAPQIHS